MQPAPTAELTLDLSTETIPEEASSLPVEIRLSLLFTAVFFGGLLFGLPLNLPDARSLRFVEYHYFAPVLLAFALQLPVVWFSGRRNQGDPFLLLKLVPFLVLAILLHFNFKAWMPLVNGRSYDEAFQAVDELFWPVVAAFSWLRGAIADILPWNLNRAYHSLFVLMFFVAFSAHALCDRPEKQRQLVLGVCLILLAGGLMYWIAPAVGPFIYREGLNPDSTRSQHYMMYLFHGVVSSGELPPGYFTAPLAAMPSLHVAHALFFTLFAARSLRWLFWAFLPLLLWIVLESVATGWHYLIDLPVGAGLALVVLVLIRRMVPEEKEPEKSSLDLGKAPIEVESSVVG